VELEAKPTGLPYQKVGLFVAQILGTKGPPRVWEVALQYGRTVLEVILFQAILIAAILVIPFGVIASLSPEVSGLIATAVAGALGVVLFMRHTSRMQRADRSQFKAQTQSTPA
jgi:hypothetical protein